MTKKKLVTRGSLLLVVVVIIVGAKIVFSQLNRPAVATFTPVPGGKNQYSYQIDLTPKRKTGKYISFDYPAGLNVYPSQVTGPELEVFNFSAQDVETWFLGIEVSTTRFGKLTDSSSYTYRKNTPTVYHETQETLNGQLVTIMTDTTVGGFSKVAFILHGNTLATISLQGDDSSGVAPLQTTFSMILMSWHWL